MVTPEVAVLEASGWATRTTDPADGRARTLTITEAGRAVLAGTLARMADPYAGVLEDWSDDDLRSLHATPARLRQDFARVSEPALAA